VRVFRIVLIVLGVLLFALAISKLNDRRIDKTGLCGSIVQGSRYDDGGSSTSECNRLRHRDGVAAAAFATLGIVAIGVVAGHFFYARKG
jgi:hypothetical protein